LFPRRFFSPFEAAVPLLFVHSFATTFSSVSKDKRDLPEEYKEGQMRERGERRTREGEGKKTY